MGSLARWIRPSNSKKMYVLSWYFYPVFLIATQVCVSSLTLFFTTTEEVMLNRLLERGKTSGREDDNVESIKKRFRTYKNDTMPVIEYHATLNKVVEVRILC